MRRTMEIRLRRIEGAVSRTVSLIEQRGFSVASITIRPAANTDEMRVHVDVEASRRAFPALAAQIRRLSDVSAVSLSGFGIPCGRTRTGHELSIVRGDAEADGLAMRIQLTTLNDHRGVSYE